MALRMFPTKGTRRRGNANQLTPPAFKAPGGWAFEYDDTAAIKESSGRKRMTQGTFWRDAAFGRRATAAIAIEFVGDNADLFGTECATLAKANALGVGPRLLQVTRWVRHEGEAGVASVLEPPSFVRPGEMRLTVDDLPIALSFEFENGIPVRREMGMPVIIEEDVGVSLLDALFGRVDVPGVSPHPLHRPGTPEREVENAKIKFDVMSQLMNLHDNDLYHRDLRPANVCVHRFGKRPQDIRATLIDFELVGPMTERTPRAISKPYVRAIFPRNLDDKSSVVLNPSPSEFDLGYLAGLFYELDHEVRVWDASGDLLDGTLYPFFVNTGHGYLRIRALSQRDLVPYAQKAGLTPVDAEHLGSHEAVQLANRIIRHGGYLDARDEEELHDEPLHYILMERERLVRASYDTYKEARKRDGKKVEYGSFEEQPADLQEQNYDLFARYPERLARFGYALAISNRDLPEGEVIESHEQLPPEDLEAMAEDEHNRWWALKEKQGWRPWDGKPEDLPPRRERDARRINVDMVPYGELDERTKEYDRKNVRNMFTFLREIGLVVYRPQRRVRTQPAGNETERGDG